MNRNRKKILKRKRKKRKKIIITSIITLLIFIFSFLIIFSNYNKLTLKGKKNIKIDVGKEYVEQGIKAYHCNFFKCKDITNKVSITNYVDTNIIGKYKVIYTLKYNNKNKKKIRNVNVVDEKKPIITLEGGKNKTICPGQNYKDEGYKAIDNYDGDITNNVIVKTTKNAIKYTVTDSSKNTTSITRKIKYADNNTPIITLEGEDIIYIEKGKEYQEPGYNIYDECDGDITEKGKIINEIDNENPGTYNIIYETKDKAGNKVQTTRTIIVYEINTTKVNEYIKELENYIKSKGYKLSIGYYDLISDYKYTYNGNVVYYGASLIKTVDALYIYENANEGKIDLDEKITIQSKNIRAYSLGLEKYKVGDKISLRDVVKYNISVSDNTAHAMLVNYIGFYTLKSYGNSIGGKHTLIGGDNYGNTDVNDQIAYMIKLYYFIKESSNGEELKQYFINDYYNYISYEGLPTVGHKYGYYNSYFHDVGIVWDDRPYIVAILSNSSYVNRIDIFKDISKKIYELHSILYN